MAREGFRLIGDELGLALLDAADAAGEALLVPAPLDLAGLRGRGQDLPPLLSGLVRPRLPAGSPGRRARTATAAWRPGWPRCPRPSGTRPCGRSCWRRPRWCWGWPGRTRSVQPVLP